MSAKLIIPKETALVIPIMEIKTEKDPEGNVRIAHQKRFAFGALRDLAHDLMERSEEADKEKNADDYSDLVAVVLLLAASLESFVNDMLIALAHRDYGKDYKQIAEGLLGGSIRSRILRIIPVASRGLKRLDTGHNTIGLVFKLIKTRNQLAHTNEYYIENTSWDDATVPPLGKALRLDECTNYAAAVDTYISAVLSGMLVLQGNTPWEHELVVDAEPEHKKK